MIFFINSIVLSQHSKCQLVIPILALVLPRTKGSRLFGSTPLIPLKGEGRAKGVSPRILTKRNWLGEAAPGARQQTHSDSARCSRRSRRTRRRRSSPQFAINRLPGPTSFDALFEVIEAAESPPKLPLICEAIRELKRRGSRGRSASGR